MLIPDETLEYIMKDYMWAEKLDLVISTNSYLSVNVTCTVFTNLQNMLSLIPERKQTESVLDLFTY